MSKDGKSLNYRIRQLSYVGFFLTLCFFVLSVYLNSNLSRHQVISCQLIFYIRILFLVLFFVYLFSGLYTHTYLTRRVISIVLLALSLLAALVAGFHYSISSGHMSSFFFLLKDRSIILQKLWQISIANCSIPFYLGNFTLSGLTFGFLFLINFLNLVLLRIAFLKKK